MIHRLLLCLSLALPNRIEELNCTDSRYGLPYHGQSGLQVGFLVAFTQLIPEHQIQLLGKIKMRVKVSQERRCGQEL
jgi:hypothetical protein